MTTEKQYITQIFPGGMVFVDKMDVHSCAVCEKIVTRRFNDMTLQQAEGLGEMLKARRKDLGVERTIAAERAGMDVSTLYRLEHGQILSPDPAKLRNLARVLRLRVADVLAAAGYPTVRGLPEPGPYLRAKYRDLPAEQVAALSLEVEAVLRRYGVVASGGPTAGEDEAEENGGGS